jgi:hypothetical protein
MSTVESIHTPSGLSGISPPDGYVRSDYMNDLITRRSLFKCCVVPTNAHEDPNACMSVIGGEVSVMETPMWSRLNEDGSTTSILPNVFSSTTSADGSTTTTTWF